MKKIIDGLRYDTETAEELHYWFNGRSSSDFRYRAKTLYRTKNGRFFIHHEGGPMTDLALPVGNGYTGSEDIEPVSEEDAFLFLISHGGVAVAEKLFPERIQDA